MWNPASWRITKRVDSFRYQVAKVTVVHNQSPHNVSSIYICCHSVIYSTIFQTHQRWACIYSTTFHKQKFKISKIILCFMIRYQANDVTPIQVCKEMLSGSPYILCIQESLCSKFLKSDMWMKQLQ